MASRRSVGQSLDDGRPGKRSVRRAYVLEVTSPGVDRPLTERRHWARAVGRRVAVNGIEGRVLSTSDAGIELQSRDGTRTIGWDELGPGAVQVEFNRKAAFDDDRAEG